ncbi:phage holin [Collinsella sp. AGMB00827]|uniref:Phage holin n=1 Tax=Collinsella ureilytica TaxID=2869515 RepID=A0ABS7MK50_9ACTN|nr:phage holin [Collinsella urealyticum]MBY4796775.1 phage holin [Collinsella urealyticum]
MINWKLRLKNKATLAALASAAVVFAANVATALGVTLPVGQEQAMAFVMSLLTVLAALGVITDPTTAGVGDSNRAMTYTEPKRG